MGVARSCLLILRIIPGLENRVKGPQISHGEGAIPHLAQAQHLDPVDGVEVIDRYTVDAWLQGSNARVVQCSHCDQCLDRGQPFCQSLPAIAGVMAGEQFRTCRNKHAAGIIHSDLPYHHVKLWGQALL